jgi:cysteinyl-tRNA synthetase
LANVAPDAQGVDWNEPQAQAFKAAMDDDFNTSGAVAALFQLATDANKTGSARAAGQLKALAGLLGLLQQDPQTYLRTATRYGKEGAEGLGQAALGDEDVQALIDARAAAKQARDFAEADRLRGVLRDSGIELEDKPGGVTNWRRV